jgi:DNA modification methylase
VIPTDWPSERVKAYLAADNELARLGDPDLSQLAALVEDVASVDETLARLAAGTEERLRELVEWAGNGKLPEDPGPQIDKAAELQEKWGVSTGDLWIIPSKTADGEHRVICGDCTDGAVVERVTEKKIVQLFVSDPPYNASEHGRDYGVRSTDFGEWDKGFDIVKWWKVWEPELSDNHTAYVFGHHRTLAPLWLEWEKDANYTAFICWEKPAPPPNLLKVNWTWAIELIAFRQMAKKTFNLQGDGRNLLRENAPRGPRRIHPTEKPIAIIDTLLEVSSNLGNLVCDPCLGSGTTLVACERLARLGRGVEIEPKYVAVTLERLSQMGLEPLPWSD